LIYVVTSPGDVPCFQWQVALDFPHQQEIGLVEERLTEVPIIGFLQQAQSGLPVAG